MTLPAQVGVAAMLGAVNAMTFAAFAVDKARAEAGARRIREATLLRLAALGGTPAAYAARRLCRHKTRKQPFSSMLHAIATLQVIAVTTWLWVR